MLILLQLRGRLTAQALAEEFEVSERTIYRDIDELSAAGVPVYADRGPGGGFRLLDGYRTKLTGLSAAEAETLLLAGLPDAAADLGIAAPLATAQLKLLASLPPAAGSSAARIASRFHLDPLDWFRSAAPPTHLPAIAQAVWSQKRIAIRYESWSKTIERKIDPLGLVMKAGAWYMVGRAQGSLRTYKVAKVLELDTLGEDFPFPEDFDLAAHWRSELKRFERSLRRGEATLRVSPAAFAKIDSLGTDVAEAVLAAPIDKEGWRRAVVPVESLDRTAKLLLAFSDEIEVIDPAPLRESLAAHARRILALYADRLSPPDASKRLSTRALERDQPRG
jgi:predicted DNA-binding transcriptional regulator YafY